MGDRTAPYNICIFGPGDAGCIIIREACRLPEFEIVGVFVFQEQKDGVDAGALAGINPIGIKATRSWEEFLAIDCDVVVHTALDSPATPPLSTYIRLLEAGKNVLTTHPYSYLPARDKSFGDEIKAACQRGKATFHAGGLNPDFMTQRFTTLLTGLSNDVKQIKIEEYFDCADQKNAGLLKVIGLGGVPDETIDENSPAIWYQKHYNYQMIQHLGEEFGVKISRIGGDKQVFAAPQDITRPVMNIKKGETGRISYTSTGYLEDDTPFISITITYFFDTLMRPEHLEPDNTYIVTIEGRPSTRTVLSIRPSYLTEAKEMGNEPAAPAYFTFAVTILQAVSVVVAAPPGFKAPDIPVVHWKKDQRKNVGRCYTEY